MLEVWCKVDDAARFDSAALFRLQARLLLQQQQVLFILDAAPIAY